MPSQYTMNAVNNRKKVVTECLTPSKWDSKSVEKAGVIMVFHNTVIGWVTPCREETAHDNTLFNYSKCIFIHVGKQ